MRDDSVSDKEVGGTDRVRAGAGEDYTRSRNSFEVIRGCPTVPFFAVSFGVHSRSALVQGQCLRAVDVGRAVQTRWSMATVYSGLKKQLKGPKRFSFGSVLPAGA